MKPIACLFIGFIAWGAASCASRTPVSDARVEQASRPTSAAGQSDSPISAEAARQDFETLYRSLQSAHYNLYVYRPKAEYDAYFGEVFSRLSGPMSRLELVRELQPFVAFGKVGHARIEFPIEEYIRAAQEGGTVLPFDIRIDGGRVFIAHSYLPESRIQPGVELVAFDDVPALEVVTNVSRYVSGERPYMLHAQQERFFPRWLWVERGSIGSLKVTGRTAGGEPFVETISGLPIGQVEPLKSEWSEALSPREVRLIDERTAYLRPGPFYNIDGGDAMKVEAFRDFIDEAFRKILAAQSQTLLIDVRDNPGGDNSFSDLMVAWFATRSFRFSNEFSIKVSPEIRRQFADHAAQSTDHDGIVVQMDQAMRGKKDGDIIGFELPEVSPRQDRFHGRVFLLINRHSYSNATSLAAMVQDYGFGKIIGEETADLATSYASSAQFTLPNSGLVVTYPKGHFVRPNGDRALRGVVPDFPIAQDVFLQGPEAVLEAALRMIDARRP